VNLNLKTKTVGASEPPAPAGGSSQLLPRTDFCLGDISMKMLHLKKYVKSLLHEKLGIYFEKEQIIIKMGHEWGPLFPYLKDCLKGCLLLSACLAIGILLIWAIALKVGWINAVLLTTIAILVWRMLAILSKGGKS